ncbi:MAG: hypothetical protein WCV91_00485 [Candidatus Margulisiibacteriota bacterium]
MAAISDGLSNIYALTAKIIALKEQAKSGDNSSASNIDPQESVLYLQQTFYEMLSKLTASSDEEDKNKDASDPFAFLSSSNQLSTDLSSQLNEAGSTTANNNGISIDPYTGTLNTTLSTNETQLDLLAKRSELNLTNLI